MTNGGYILVDCTGIDLNTATKQTITGIFNQVETAFNSGKPVYACGATFNISGTGNFTSPVNVMVNSDENGGYVATASTLQLWIDKDDGVTIVNLAPANKSSKTSK